MMMKQAVKKIINASLKSRGFRLCRTDDQTGSTWEYDYLHNQIDDLKMLSSKMVIDHMNARGIYSSIHEVEFKVFSQCGDDGIIQYLIRNAEVDVEKFVEFGVESTPSPTLDSC